MVREILVQWTTNTGGGKYSVLYFDESTLVADQRSQLATYLATMNGGLHNSTSWNIATSGRVLDTASGTLTGLWNDATARNGVGTVSTGQVVPDATQILVQWLTNVVVNGRVVRGRTYIPGTSTANVTAGNLAPTVRSSFQTDANAFVAACPSFRVWHRPTNKVGGVAVGVSAATCWGEFAIQRRRRG